MQLDLAILESPLAVVQANLGQSLHGILDVGQEIVSAVNSAICANAEDIGQLDAVGENQVDPVMRVA